METDAENSMANNFFSGWVVNWISDLFKESLMSTLDFLDYVRRQTCLVHGSPAEPHHLKSVGQGGNRKREMIEHFTAIPVCRDCHMELEHPPPRDFPKRGDKWWRNDRLRSFEEKHNINLWRENSRLLARWIWEGR